MTTIYVAGPMTGLPEYNYPAFHKAADELRALGYTVLSPATKLPMAPTHLTPKLTTRDGDTQKPRTSVVSVRGFCGKACSRAT